MKQKEASVLGELEKVNEGWQLRFVRELRHSPERVWRALTEPQDLAKWFPDTIFVPKEWRVGASLHFKHEGVYAFDGEVLVYEPPRVLELRWGTDLLRFEIEPRGSGSVLTLIDTIDEVGKAARDSAGWHACLDRLEHALDGVSQPSLDDEWPALNCEYARKFGPEAATIAPPEGIG